MTKEELERIESLLKDNGYKRCGEYSMVSVGDYYWWKAFGKEYNKYEEGRNFLIVKLNVYEWFKFWKYDPLLEKCNKYASITVTYDVSRLTYEVRKELNYDLKDAEFDLGDIEDKAFKFYHYIDENFKL